MLIIKTNIHVYNSDIPFALLHHCHCLLSGCALCKKMAAVHAALVFFSIMIEPSLIKHYFCLFIPFIIMFNATTTD